MRFSTLCSLPFVCLALWGCAADDDATEDVATASEAILNGTPLDAEGSGFVRINDNCSGTLVSNDWVLTAKHCSVARGSRVSMGRQLRVVASVVNHRVLDIALAHLEQPMTMGGSTRGYRKLIRATPLNVGDQVGCAGYGPDGPFDSFGQLRVATLRIAEAQGHLYRVEPNALGQIQMSGDSGGSCLDANRQIAGVAHRAFMRDGLPYMAYETSSAAFAQWVNDRIDARTIALRAWNGSFVTAVNGGGGAFSATGWGVTLAETFTRVDLGDNKIALRASNGSYVVAEGGGGSVVNANRGAMGPWEIFTEVDLGDGMMALKAQNGQYVVAAGGGGGAVNATSGAVGPWETFARIDLAGDEVALQAQNGQHVVAESGGGSVVNANRAWIGPWERFRLIDLHGQVALRSVNGYYLVAEQGGGGAVNADRPWIGPWERFYLYDRGDNTIALQAQNGRYLVAVGGGGSAVSATSASIGLSETFTLVLP